MACCAYASRFCVWLSCQTQKSRAYLPVRPLGIFAASPATEGRANEALCAYLAELLGTAKTRVKLLKGGNSRSKLVAVRGARRTPESVFPPEKTTP